MTTLFLTHPDCLNHLTPQGHPEQVARLEVILDRLGSPEFKDLTRTDAPLGTDEMIRLAHPARHIAVIRKAAPETGSVMLDADTHMSAGSLKAALRGVGGIVEAVDRVMAKDAQNAFVACRPPGHHAEKAIPMGFCLFGTVVIGAKHALENHGLERVAIVDFDVHHGNGTQDLVWDNPRIFFASTHEMPLYPGSGAADETGAHGQIMNIPLRSGANGSELRQAFEGHILPALRAHKPEMILISAGFDAHLADPLANLSFTEDDFAWATEQLCNVADEVCEGRVVSTLEGGYDLQALAASVAAHVTVLMEHAR